MFNFKNNITEQVVNDIALLKNVNEKFKIDNKQSNTFYFENNEYPYIIKKEKKSIGFIDIAIEKNFFLLRRIYLDKPYRRQRLGTQILENIITFSKLTNKELRVNVYDEEAEKFYKRLGFRKNFTNYVIRRQ